MEPLGGKEFTYDGGKTRLGVERVYRRRQVALTLTEGTEGKVLAYFTSQANADRFLGWLRGFARKEAQ